MNNWKTERVDNLIWHICAGVLQKYNISIWHRRASLFFWQILPSVWKENLSHCHAAFTQFDNSPSCINLTTFISNSFQNIFYMSAGRDFFQEQRYALQCYIRTNDNNAVQVSTILQIRLQLIWHTDEIAGMWLKQIRATPGWVQLKLNWYAAAEGDSGTWVGFDLGNVEIQSR